MNVRVKKFLDTEQIQIYSKDLITSKDRVSVDVETGEFVPNGAGRPVSEKGFMEYNPFTDECERMYRFTDPERSASVSHARTIHKIYDIARSNRWDWFVTLTFNGEKVNRYDYSICTKKLSQWLKNVKKVCPDMIYIVVPENHKDGAWHFHGLFGNCDKLSFVDSGVRDKNGRVIYNIGSYHLGWTTATPVTDLKRVSSYVTKYVTKDLLGLTKGKKHYWASRNVKLPEIIDIQIDDLTDFRRCMVEQSGFVKTVNGEYLDVTYIEVEKGSSEAELFGEQSIRQISSVFFKNE